MRPHDIRVGRNPEMAIAGDDDSVRATGVVRATIDRIVVLGFEVRVELTSAADHTPFTAQITRGDAEALGLKEGDTVYVRATRVPSLPGGTDIPRADDGRRGRGADEGLSSGRPLSVIRPKAGEGSDHDTWDGVAGGGPDPAEGRPPLDRVIFQIRARQATLSCPQASA